MDFGSWKLGIGSSLATIVFAAAAAAQAPAPPAVPAARFVGTWVGTQAWAIKDPPPGANNEQPVTLDIQIVDGKITGTMRPFLGGEDGATITEAKLSTSVTTTIRIAAWYRRRYRTRSSP